MFVPLEGYSADSFVNYSSWVCGWHIMAHPGQVDVFRHFWASPIIQSSDIMSFVYCLYSWERSTCSRGRWGRRSILGSRPGPFRHLLGFVHNQIGRYHVLVYCLYSCNCLCLWRGIPRILVSTIAHECAVDISWHKTLTPMCLNFFSVHIQYLVRCTRFRYVPMFALCHT